MKEISMNLLDIAENSVAAGATLVEITLRLDRARDELWMIIADDGKGMSPETLERVVDPFYTTRTTRKVGLGIPLLKEGCEQTGGSLTLTSTVGVGTRVEALFRPGNIDCPPLGDVAGSMLTLIVCNPQLDFCFRVCCPEEVFCLDTRQIREILGAEVALNDPEVAGWIRENLVEGCAPLR
ncbi:MAG: ATP-binding protein [Christensenellales bacterium]|jgi:hypothetical protein